MLDEQRFGIRAFGGFKKREVLEYINDLVKKHEEEIKKLKQQNEEHNEELKNKLEEELIISNEYKEKIDELEKLVRYYNKNINSNFSEKEDYLKSQNEYVQLLESKVKDLEETLENTRNLNNLNANIEENIKKAEAVAKEKVKRIIKEGREKILNEYEEQLKKLEEKKQDLKNIAIEEASKILNNAASRVYRLNDEVKKQSLELLEAAELVSNELLRESFKIAVKQAHSSNFRNNLLKKFNVKILNEIASKNVLDAIEKLKSLNFLDENLELKGKEPEIKKRRRFNFNEFKKEEETE